jgi:hypothetical protein
LSVPLTMTQIRLPRATTTLERAIKMAQRAYGQRMGFSFTRKPREAEFNGSNFIVCFRDVHDDDTVYIVAKMPSATIVEKATVS